ncbi:MAG: glycosyltransferase [Actinobacteria bacterium]|uniref:Unannotated protein n=1 Tax=freshwater metagenome TaxID=449393 RepID=A0A6J6PK36_9ZZZZ|nr:glycosyltransferase [Actinomycetota bacterium]
MTRVGLTMIVKDEAHVIERCLRSVVPLIDWWVVVDTGSTDGTQEVVRRVLGELPGEVVERPWVDFGHNRQEALDLARTSAYAGEDDYAVWIDADEHFTDVPIDGLGGLDADGYFLPVTYAGTHYARLALVRLASGWRWTGAIHEYLTLDPARTAHLPAPGVWVEHTGARSLDPDTYRKDAALIRAQLAKDPTDARMQFYLGQSLRDAGDLVESLAAYAVRVDNPHGWDQERWFALLQMALLAERLGHPAGEVVDAYLRAYDACPWRAETLVELARVERSRERYHAAVLFARQATTLPRPASDALFVEEGAYTWRCWDELAISCYWTGQYAEGAAAAQRALDVHPDDERLRANLAWCQGQL